MANIIIKSDEHKADVQRVMQSFGIDPRNAEGREHAECIAARSREAYNELNRMEDRK